MMGFSSVRIVSMENLFETETHIECLAFFKSVFIVYGLEFIYNSIKRLLIYNLVGVVEREALFD